MTPQESFKLALQAHQSGNSAEAERLLRQMVLDDPKCHPALHFLGVLALQARNYADAHRWLSQAAAIHPAGEYFSTLGVTFSLMGQPQRAIEAFTRAVELNPDLPETHNNLGSAYANTQKWEPAIASFRAALARRPDYPDARRNLNQALLTTGNMEGALESWDQAVKYQPDDANAHWELAVLLMLTGKWERGWQEMEWRWKAGAPLPDRTQFPGVPWDGGDLNNRRILLHAEQGYGDAIQFVRYARLVAERGGRVVLAVPPELSSLLKRAQGVEEVVVPGAPLTDIAFHSPLMSLPRFFGTTPDNVPCREPYLRADSALADRWRQRLDPEDRRRRVGIVWAGKQSHHNDRNRSTIPELFSPLRSLANIRLYNLQLQAPAPQGLVDWTSDLTDFDQTAALIENLDLVISVDTAAAHLASAMGKPVWLLLPMYPDWRWMLDRADSPWYPTMRIFRQEKLGDWAGAMSRVTEAIKGS